MKKLLIAALLAVSVSASSIAQDASHIDRKAMGNFEVTYAGASGVDWTSTGDFTKASFVQNEKKIDVFYNLDGDFVAATTKLKVDEIPASIKRSLEKRYSDYVVKEALQYKSYDEVSYFIALENQKEDIVLKVTGGSLSVYSSTDKN